MKTTFQIHIQGLVQGVGFRPFIYKLANDLNLKGRVENRNDGVYIRLNGDHKTLSSFIDLIREQAPKASNIYNITTKIVDYEYFVNFKINQSENTSDQITEISADIAVCPDCLNDMKEQKHRFAYPFTNCTNCGPRFTIIKKLPYDRHLTTMEPFRMCERCKAEYYDITNRRFHAQPVACTECGPKYQLFYKNKTIETHEDVLSTVTQLVDNDDVIAIKGLGGFHFMCNAYSSSAVNHLRRLKTRESKPFAVMCKDIDSVEKIAYLSSAESTALQSWQRPIVLLKSKNKLAGGVQNILTSVGVMLPYMPFHYQLFEHLKTDCVVLTSGNFSDEPIVIQNDMAIKLFKDKVAAILVYNRDIYNRTDDSVVQLVNNKQAIIRRSRGYAPSSIPLLFGAEGIFAAGAELVATFAMGKQSRAILSQHIGDLKNAETFDFYKESYRRFSSMFRFYPKMVAIDLHPDYLSSQFGADIADNLDIPLVKVQHHHAHTCAVMAEYGLNEKVIGVSLDGIGLGTNNKIWGAEFHVADYSSFERYYHFKKIKIIGFDKVSTQPWRSALSYLIANKESGFLDDYIKNQYGDLMSQMEMYRQIYAKDMTALTYSSAGRLFDAVSSMLNLCKVSNFHAEAPMRLESIIDEKCAEYYGFSYDNKEINLREMISGIVDDIRKGVAEGFISAKFHNTIVKIVVDTAILIRKAVDISKIVLSGGTFQNRYLAGNCLLELQKNGFETYFPQKIPVNDAGISLGQIAIAAYGNNGWDY